MGLALSAIAMALGMAPYICVWLVVRDLIAVAPDWTRSGGIARCGWLAFAFAAVGIVVYFAALLWTHLAAFRTASNIRKAGVAHLMKTPLGFFDNNASGLLRNRLDGASAETETLLAHNLADIVGTVAMFVAMLVLLFVFDWRMGAACLLAAVVSVLTMFSMMGGKNAQLVGPSGSGKTTAASLIPRFWDVSSGAVEVGGVDVREIDPHVLMDHIAFVFQNSRLFKASILENVRAARPAATREEVQSALGAAQCGDILAKLPNGMDTLIGSEGTYLSGGERQRISIARALLKDAPIVLLDEATASLDVENETKVQSALSRLLAGKTVLVIAHRMRTVEAADRIVVLADGKVAEEGSPDELLGKEDGIFRHMAELQAVGASWRI